MPVSGAARGSPTAICHAAAATCRCSAGCSFALPNASCNISGRKVLLRHRRLFMYVYFFCHGPLVDGFGGFIESGLSILVDCVVGHAARCTG